jgi:hypothetical protein
VWWKIETQKISAEVPLNENPEEHWCLWAVAAAGLLDMLVVATEQNPARLGNTLKSVGLQVSSTVHM